MGKKAEHLYSKKPFKIKMSNASWVDSSDKSNWKLMVEDCDKKIYDDGFYWIIESKMFSGFGLLEISEYYSNNTVIKRPTWFAITYTLKSDIVNDSMKLPRIVKKMYRGFNPEKTKAYLELKNAHNKGDICSYGYIVINTKGELKTIKDIEKQRKLNDFLRS